MSWANLGGLLWLLPVCGAIIALYLLRIRRKQVRVPAIFLWPEQVNDVRANTLFQKLRFSWLLVLQLLAALLIVATLARPQLMQRGLGGAVTVVVLDTSASMQATDVSPSRMAAAASMAEQLVSQAKLGDRVSIIEAGTIPRVLISNSFDAAKLRAALRSARPTDAETDVGEALRLASSIVNKQESARIVLFSDGDFPEVTDFSAGGAELTFQKVGLNGKNVGVSGFGVSGEGANRFIYAGVRNFSLDAASGTLNLYADGKLFDSSGWTAPADQTVGRTIRAPAGARVFEAKVKFDDPLQADNYAAVVNDPGASIRTLLISKGDLFLERALALDPRVQLEKTSEPPSSGEWDLIVYDGVPEARLRAKAVLNFGSAGPASPVRLVSAVSRPVPQEGQDHPVLKDVSFDDAFIEKGQKVEAKSSAQVLAEMRTGGETMPLVVLGRSGGVKSLYFAFQPMESDFPLQIGFPVFIANAIDELLPPLSLDAPLSVSPGRTLAMPSPDEKSLELVSPQGEHTTIKPVRGRHIVRSIDRVGEYKLAGRSIYSTLISDVESHIRPSDSLRVGGKAVHPAANMARLADLWRWALAAVLLVLCLEWWMFLKRS